MKPLRLAPACAAAVLALVTVAVPAAAQNLCSSSTGYVLPGFTARPSLAIYPLGVRFKDALHRTLIEKLKTSIGEELRDRLTGAGYFGAVELLPAGAEASADLVLEGQFTALKLGADSFGLGQTPTLGADDKASRVSITATITARASSRMLAIFDCVATANAGTAEGKAVLAVLYIARDLASGYRAASKQLKDPNAVTTDVDNTQRFYDGLNRGMAAWQNSDYATAARHYRLALEARPTSAPTLGNLGMVLRYLADAAASDEEKTALLSESVRMFESALKEAPQHGASYRNLGSLYGRLGRFEDAEKALLRAVQLDPSDADFTYFLLGSVYLDAKDPRRARDALLTSLRIAPNGRHVSAVREKLNAMAAADLARAENAGAIARVWVFRGSEGSGDKSIFANGLELARIRDGRFIEVKLAPGKYDFGSDKPGRPTIALELEAGKSYYIKSKVSIRAGEQLELVDEVVGRAVIPKLKPVDARFVVDTARVVR